MPKGLREIRNRIKSVKSTGQITRAMQLVASSKMKRAQDSARAGRAYAELLGEILDTAQSKVGDFTHPLLTKREVKVRGILLVTPDKGMAGALNGNLVRLAAEQKDAVFVCIGRKGAQALARSGRKVLADFPVTDRANFSEVRPAAEYLIKAFTEGTVDTVEVLFAHFKNTMVQTPRVLQLLPADSLVVQAREFHKAISLTGVVLTKLDGSGKGGIAIAIQHELGIPTRFIGTGEKETDFAPFDRDKFVDSLL
jgi:F-type H+-transporting ATPase subunit gamma